MIVATDSLRSALAVPLTPSFVLPAGRSIVIYVQRVCREANRFAPVLALPTV